MFGVLFLERGYKGQALIISIFGKLKCQGTVVVQVKTAGILLGRLDREEELWLHAANDLDAYQCGRHGPNLQHMLKIQRLREEDMTSGDGCEAHPKSQMQSMLVYYKKCAVRSAVTWQKVC